MDCVDMRSALLTVAKLPASVEMLEIHMSSSVIILMARNLLLTHVMLSSNFDPACHEDMDYLWSIWYSYQWSEAIRNRFVSDLKE